MGLIIIALLVLGMSRYADLQRLDELIFGIIWVAFAFMWLAVV